MNEELISCVEIIIWAFSSSLLDKLAFRFDDDDYDDSVQSNRYLLTCRVNCTSVNYKAGTKTQIQHKNGNTELTKQKQCGRREAI